MGAMVTQETVSKPATADKQRRPPTRILLVEDNQDSAELLQMILQEFGYDVRVCFEGRTAIEQAAGFRPDMVILDIGLPDMSGYEVAEALRANENLSNMGLVALTGFGQPDHESRAREVGFDEHVVKPVDVATLSQVIEQVREKVRDRPQ